MDIVKKTFVLFSLLFSYSILCPAETNVDSCLYYSSNNCANAGGKNNPREKKSSGLQRNTPANDNNQLIDISREDIEDSREERDDRERARENINSERIDPPSPTPARPSPARPVGR